MAKGSTNIVNTVVTVLLVVTERCAGGHEENFICLARQLYEPAVFNDADH